MRILLLSALLGQSLFGAWGVAQYQEVTAAASDSAISMTLTSAVASGSLIVVGVQFGSNTSVTCGDDASQSYTQIQSTLYSSGSGSAFAMFYFANSTSSSSLTVTCSFGAGVQYRTLLVGVYTGGATSYALDTSSAKTETAGNTSTDGITMAQITTGTNGCLIIGLVEQLSPWAATTTAGTNFTLHSAYGMEYQVQTSAGAITPTFTFSAADGYHGFAAAFKPYAASARRRQVVIQ